MNPSHQRHLDKLSTFLRRRREPLLSAWRAAVAQDPQLTTPNALSRMALNDHIPDILATLEGRLRSDQAADELRAESEQRQQAAEHGAHRWQQGYDFRETLREWGHLQRILLGELDRYVSEHPGVPHEVMAHARGTVATLFLEGACESATRYLQLQQTEAAGRVRDLENSLESLQKLTTERTWLLRQTAHDLRGSVGVFATASAALTQPELLGPQRQHFQQMLQQHIRSMSELLGELITVARLEAGQESLHVRPFDAAACLRETVDALRPVASARNLFLRCEGPATLPVQGDPMKVQRILQNLLLNALKATQRGGVVVRWDWHTQSGAQQWSFWVQDTGPGLALERANPLRAALKDVTEQAVEVAHSDSGPEQAEPPLLRSLTPQAAATPPAGEGIGLTIVKRLCDLLAARIEFNAAADSGTTFQITLPTHYPKANAG